MKPYTFLLINEDDSFSDCNEIELLKETDKGIDLFYKNITHFVGFEQIYSGEIWQPFSAGDKFLIVVNLNDEQIQKAKPLVNYIKGHDNYNLN